MLAFKKGHTGKEGVEDETEQVRSHGIEHNISIT